MMSKMENGKKGTYKSLHNLVLDQNGDLILKLRHAGMADNDAFEGMLTLVLLWTYR